MKQDATRKLYDYWNVLRGERAAPDRGDIDPAAIRGILADTFMLDLDVTQRFAVRLAGTRVNGLFDAEQKGRSFLELWRPEERRNIAAVLMTVADGACPAVVGAAGAPTGYEDCGFEILFLPLRHFGRTHARILGMITPTARPVWLGLLPPTSLSLRSLRVVDTPPAMPAWRPSRIAVGAQLVSAQLEQPVEGGIDGIIDISERNVKRERSRLRVIQGGRSDN